MQIDTLYLESFRNYEQQFLEFDPACNVIYGENAQGKTNLLEALAYLSCGKSPRARTDRDMIRFGGQAAVMTAGVFVREREFQVRAELSRERRRKLLINQVPVKTGAELSRVYNTVFFCPEDLLLIREGAAARRRFLDVTLSQLRPRYAEALAQYHRTYVRLYHFVLLVQYSHQLQYQNSDCVHIHKLKISKGYNLVLLAHS